MFEWLVDRYWRWRGRRNRAAQREWESAARARGLAPAYADLGGFLAVDRAGDVWCSETPDGWDAATRVAEPDVRFAAIGVAVGRHPELARLVPDRRPEDPTCPTCRGRGSPADLPPRLRDRILCQCGGLGWLPAELARTPQVPEPPDREPPAA